MKIDDLQAHNASRVRCFELVDYLLSQFRPIWGIEFKKIVGAPTSNMIILGVTVWKVWELSVELGLSIKPRPPDQNTCKKGSPIGTTAGRPIKHLVLGVGIIKRTLSSPEISERPNKKQNVFHA